MTIDADLNDALQTIANERSRLIRTVAPLSGDALGVSRPGGWSIGRALQHVIESEATYAKLLAHLCGTVARESDTTEPASGAEAVARLASTRESVLSAVGGIGADTLYRLVRFGHEEYSALSVLQNIAAHDADHRAQIAVLLAARGAERTRRLAPADVSIRPAHAADLARLTEIYNHYIINTPITFDLEPVSIDERRSWFEQFGETGRHRLFVAERAGVIEGYAGTHQFRTKKAYDTTVETTVYCAPESTGRGIGNALYAALFGAIAAEDVRVAVAGITLPNEASMALHERFGFEPVGLMHGVGRKFGRYWDVAWYERQLR